MSTLPKISELTPEQMRVMCAEARGWSFDRWGKDSIRITAPKGYESDNWRTSSDKNSITIKLNGAKFEDAKMHYADGCPKYDTSLDAMAEAEATLTDQEHFEFRLELMRQSEQEWKADPDSAGHRRERFYQSRTALQRLAAWLVARHLALP